MGGGELVIRGNTDFRTGNAMSNGKIVVEGDVGWYTGDFVSGGEIFVEGEIGVISPGCKGIIYHKGEKVWPEK